MNNLQSTRTDDSITLDHFSPETIKAGQIFERLSDEQKELLLQILRIWENKPGVQEVSRL